MHLRNVKFHVNSVSNPLVQDILIESGASWYAAEGRKRFVDAEFLYVSADGNITYSRENQQGRKFFETQPHKEIAVELKTVVVLSEPVRETIELFGRTYFKDELETALKTLAEAK